MPFTLEFRDGLWWTLDEYESLEDAFAAKALEVALDKSANQTYLYRIREDRIVYEGE
jgi:hypothetical protein